MGPLVPDIIGNEINLLIALFIGIAFGFILEQAGFSSSKKLAGLFYGYDFVVLRVFFTAAITAVVGVIILGNTGLINLDLLYINPTYVRPMILGGLIMGAGFILGGFCPGTSVCAAAIGKLDAMVFIAGIGLGVLIFGEVFPLIANFFTADYLGSPYVFESLGISRGLFAFLLILMALMAFIVTTIIENKVNNRKIEPFKLKNNRYALLVFSAVIVGFSMIFMPDKKSEAIHMINSDDWLASRASVQTISMEELAFRLLERDKSIRLIDVRSTEEYKQTHIPTAVNIPLDSLSNGEWRDYIRHDPKTTVFYCEEQLMAEKASILTSYLGDNKDNKVLENGITSFHEISNVNSVESDTSLYSRNRFQANVGAELEKLRAETANKSVIKVVKKKVAGGC